jgi:7-carboxy-7-deazaguanine synthase
VTGGEPLAQQASHVLLAQLCDQGYQVSIETSGAMSIADVDSRVMIVMDLKTPDSGECERNDFSNLCHLKKTDQIKFVLCSYQDYQWACNIIQEHHLKSRCQILFSPSWNQLNHRQLADWILEDKLPVRFQLQLHKLLWDDQPGH